MPVSLRGLSCGPFTGEAWRQGCPLGECERTLTGEDKEQLGGIAIALYDTRTTCKRRFCLACIINGGNLTMLRRDYYTILGVSRSESLSSVRTAFHELARRYHPERIGPRGARFLQELVTAYHVLADPDKRRHYDQGLCHAEGKTEVREEPILAGMQGQEDASLPVAMSPLREFATLYPPTEVTLMAVLRNFVRAETQPDEPMKSVNVQVVLSPDEAARGGIATIGVPVYYPCAVCGGSGQDWLLPCEPCQAQGMVEEEETVRVRIPARVGDYTLIEKPVRGLGLHNLYLRLYVRVMS